MIMSNPLHFSLCIKSESQKAAMSFSRRTEKIPFFKRGVSSHRDDGVLSHGVLHTGIKRTNAKTKHPHSKNKVAKILALSFKTTADIMN